MPQRRLPDPEELADLTRRPSFPLDWRGCPYRWASDLTAELTRLWCLEVELGDPETYLAELLSEVWGSSHASTSVSPTGSPVSRRRVTIT